MPAVFPGLRMRCCRLTRDSDCSKVFSVVYVTVAVVVVVPVADKALFTTRSRAVLPRLAKNKTCNMKWFVKQKKEMLLEIQQTNTRKKRHYVKR